MTREQRAKLGIAYHTLETALDHTHYRPTVTRQEYDKLISYCSEAFEAIAAIYDSEEDDS